MAPDFRVNGRDVRLGCLVALFMYSSLQSNGDAALHPLRKEERAVWEADILAVALLCHACQLTSPPTDSTLAQEQTQSLEEKAALSSTSFLGLISVAIKLI